MYYQGQAAPAPDERPGTVLAGVVAIFSTVVLCMATALTLIMSYKYLADASNLSGSASDASFTEFARSNLIIVIAFYAVIGLTMGVGAIMLLRQSNGGRVMIWITGGILSAVNLCCGFSFAMILATISQVGKSTDTSGAPTTELTLATVFNFAAMLTAIIAMIVVGQRSVGRWINGTPAPVAPPVTGYLTPPPVVYPQPPQPQLPPQPQYPPQQYPQGYQGGDQYGPGQYGGGDQYGPGPTSGPPNGW